MKVLYVLVKLKPNWVI